MGSRVKILVVEDNPVTSVQLQEWLSSLNYEVFFHDRGLGTSDALVRAGAQLMLLDVGLPGLTGDAIARLVAANRLTKNVGVILYSGKSPDVLSALVSECGALGAIEKTADFAAFRQQFETLSARHFAVRETSPAT